MKVLFAVNNESISESITKKYQQEYKEIISVKNVYYFNAIIKELQKDKSYDRIVISEDLQPFSNNNYDQIDKFIFEKMDSISDEATNQNGNDIPIILICTDRREKSEPLLIKLFGIGVYNALIGKDRSITAVCQLLNKPRGKKEAKVYYHIDPDEVDYKVENEGDVSEIEIQNILNHYKRLGKNEEQYVESFDHIASQYTDSQLRLIAKFLPLNVKAVLEANSPKYQEIISFGMPSRPTVKYNDYSKKEKEKIRKEKPQSTNKEDLEIIKEGLKKSVITEPVIIPTAINTSSVKKVQGNTIAQVEETEEVNEIDNMFEDVITEKPETAKEPEIIEQNNEIVTEPQEKPKRRGRPKKVKVEETTETVVKKTRGRPKKQENIEATASNIMPEQNSTSSINLFELGDKEENKPQTEDDIVLPGIDNDFLFAQDMEKDDELSEFKNDNQKEPEPIEESVPVAEPIITPIEEIKEEPIQEPINTTPMATNNIIHNTTSMITNNQKIVAFVGTSKNGTSFLVNNTAELLSQTGINTAILDLTKNKNSYYIYTENEEKLRNIAYDSIDNLRRGNANGIEVHKNLTVYTMLPGEEEGIEDYSNILNTLTQNYSLVILDCDFETNYNYFAQAHEIYLVQSLDILTIQPLTAFLRNLKAKNALDTEKIRVVLNKMLRLKGVTEKVIIGGMAYYNDPAMSFMTELFNKDTVQYCTIPFNEQAYAKYLDGIVNCKITLNGYPKDFMAMLNKLGNMVYPLIQSNTKNNKYSNYNSQNNFSNSMNNTLNKMKNNY